MFLVDQHTRILKRLLFLLIPYSLVRVGFYFYHLNTYKKFIPDDIFESFLLGIRFDIAAICLLNLPIILLSLIPSKNKKLIFSERLLFITINSAGILASVDDYELFSFMGKRLSFDLFFITDDILEQLPQLTLHYWYFPLGSLLFAIIYYLFDKKYFKLKYRVSSLIGTIVSGFFLIGICFIGIRGGLQHKSINVQSAFTQGHNELGHLVLNTPYHFLRTLKNKSIEKVKYFKNDEEALNIIMNARDLRPRKKSEQKKNIVLIIMESFSSEYLEAGYMPFIDELKKESIFFPYHLANGRRSIDALPALLCGLPSLLDEPISKSIFSGNKFSCMPKILKDQGYTNYFYHGGSKGTMGFEAYTLSTGFDKYFSRNDYPHGDFDGTWGVYDGPYLNYFAEQLGKAPEPFLASVFTLSSHQPYSVPAEMKGKFPTGTLEIHESIGYADNALKFFFEKVKKEPWFTNTIFFITADHTSKLESKKYNNTIGRFRVPLLIYGAAEDWDTEKVTQHSDIPRTVLELLGFSGDLLPATAVSLLASDKGFGLDYADGREYLLIGLNEVLGLNKNNSQMKYSYDWESGKLTLLGESQDPLLKAYLQYFFNGLINNNLSIYR